MDYCICHEEKNNITITYGGAVSLNDGSDLLSLLNSDNSKLQEYGMYTNLSENADLLEG